MNFLCEIEKLIASNLKTYRDNSDRFIADYNNELGLTKEYNGRQLLELLQNSDDAISEEVEIKLDKDNTKLIIADKGEAFTVDGIKSLMIANLSTKTKISYIGNKGLGFRSILNWAELVNIYTNNCKISFSENIARDFFDNQLCLSESDKIKIKEGRNLTQDTIPFPILAIPSIDNDNTNAEWTTIIEIKYKKEFENDIEIQLSELKEEILLFLNNIRKITIRKTNGESIELISTKTYHTDIYEEIEIKNKKWRVFFKEKELPSKYQDKTKNEKQSYNLKVALQDDLSDDYYKLFNFFPTQVSISLPCIIHGTFELNSSRNYLNDSDKNKFILEKLLELLQESALFLTNEKVDWRPYKLLTPLANKSDSKLIETFYQNLETIKKETAIYPCISDKYFNLNKVTYYDDKFNSFFQNNFPSILPELLLPLNDEIKNLPQNEKYSHEVLVKKIDELSLTDISLSLRAELIVQLSKVVPFKDDQIRFSLLVNESGKVISKDDTTFTPAVRSNESFNIPNSVKVDFMKSNLYDHLIERFESTFDRGELRSRELQRIIKSIVNLQPYDSNNVIKKIISGTNDKLKDLQNNDEKLVCIKEMVTALYANFKIIENRQEKLNENVLLISKAFQIADAGNLFLSKTYPSGSITEVIYESILNANNYLAAIDYWELENEENNLVESFFIWVGVNKYSKIELVPCENYYSENNYFKFIFANGTDKPDDFNRGNFRKTAFSKIENFDQLTLIPISSLILLVLKDDIIRQKIESNNEVINWHYARTRPAIIPEYSYIRYKFISSGIFTKFVLEEGGEELNKLINEDLQIDYEMLGKYGFNKTDVKAILIKLGAKESFNDLSPEYIYEIIKSIPKKDATQEGRLTQTIYKMALDSFVKQESICPVPEELLLFSEKGEIREYQPHSNIYYSDNSILPKRIMDTLYILNLPKKSGENNVGKYFGVKSLKEIKIQIDEERIQYNNSCDADFNKLFESIKVYILTYRLNSPNLKKTINDSETKRREARILKQCKIHIVKNGFYNFGEKEAIPIEEKDYMNEKDSFYFKDSGAKTVDELKRDPVFCAKFAEMMCIIFKINELKNDFILILKNELQENKQLAEEDLGKEKLDEAYLLLGISRVEFNFWENIFRQKGKKLKEPIENDDILKQRIRDGLGIELLQNYNNIDFEKFKSAESIELIKNICANLSLKVSDILQSGIFSWHQAKFMEAIKDYEYKFKRLLWLKLCSLKNEQSKFISILNNYNLDFINKVEKDIQLLKYYLDVDYQGKLKEWIKEHYQIEIDDQVLDAVNIENKYSELLRSYSVEEIDIADDSFRSLLFFEGNTEVIEGHLKLKYSKDEESELTDVSETSVPIGEIIESSLTNNGREISINTIQSSSGWVHSPRTDKVKTRKGKEAEKLVYYTLVQKYGIENVKWVSGNSTTPDKNDKLHYDIEYKNQDGEWKYLEVKAIIDCYFIISNPEKEKGLSDPDKYELALVKDKDIHMVKNLFKFNPGESFNNNNKYSVQAKDYIVSFSINNHADNIK